MDDGRNQSVICRIWLFRTRKGIRPICDFVHDPRVDGRSLGCKDAHHGRPKRKRDNLLPIEDLTSPPFGCLLPSAKSSEVKSAEINPSPMPESTERPIHAVLIPWVIALVALLGWNAILPHHSRNRETDFSGESRISQPADVPFALGQAASQQVFVIPHSTCRSTILVSRVLCIEVFREVPAITSPQGAVRGRAPPDGWLA
jgi:hypothetical protein